LKEIINGDNHLSSFTRRLWALTYSCLTEFECPVIFKVQGPHAPTRQDQHITFFVPANNDNCYEVIQHIQNELQDDIRKGEEWEDSYCFGTTVQVFEYSGTDYYMKRAECKKMAQFFMKDFMDKIDKLKGSN